jgi:TRAP-type C4-dicarboxylate transport system permease small subunit
VTAVHSGQETSVEETAPRSGAGRFWAAVNRLCEVCCGVCLVLIAALTLYEIVCRYVFDSPTQWTQDFSIYLMIWCAFLGLMPTDMAGQHIRIDVWYERLSARPQAWLEVFTYIALAAFAAIAAWTAGGVVAQSLRLGRRSLSLMPIPMWIPQAALTVGLGLFCIECIRRAVLATIELRRLSR